LVSHPEAPLQQAEWEEFRHFVTRRASGEPIAYLTGEREFFGYSLIVTPAVLIPRPETELLVELAIPHFSGGPKARVLDLGAGGGGRGGRTSATPSRAAPRASRSPISPVGASSSATA